MITIQSLNNMHLIYCFFLFKSANSQYVYITINRSLQHHYILFCCCCFFLFCLFYVLHFAEDKHGIQNISTDYIIKCFIYSFLDEYFLNLLQISRYGHHFKSVRRFRKLHCDRCLYLFLVNCTFRGNNNHIILNLYHQWMAGHMYW